MNEYHQVAIDFFGPQWFENQWVVFCEERKKYSKTSLSSKILDLELSLHPLVREVFRYQGEYEGKIDFGKVPQLGASDFVLSHLGRDLKLLEVEIASRGGKIKKRLQDPLTFEATRFELLVASGYKLLGYDVEFVPEDKSKKTPDLLVKKGSTLLYVETKQRNQDASDEERYKFAGELAEEFLPLLKNRRMVDAFVRVEVKGKITHRKSEIKEALSKLIWRNQKPKSVKITIIKTSLVPELIELLKSGGHFGKVPVYTRTEDSFIISDNTTRNVFYLNKDLAEEKVPSNVFEELYDANSKRKGDKPLIVYYDFGRGFTEWSNNFGKEIYEKSKEFLKDLPNIDCYILCQTPLKFKGVTTEVRPSFNFIGAGDMSPEKVVLFGNQGKTGMDDYLMKEFLNEPK